MVIHSNILNAPFLLYQERMRDCSVTRVFSTADYIINIAFRRLHHGCSPGQHCHRFQHQQTHKRKTCKVEKPTSKIEAKTEEKNGALARLFFLSPFLNFVQERDNNVASHTDEISRMEVEVEIGLNVEYVSEQLDISEAGLEAFSDVFARFQLPPEEFSVGLFGSFHLFSFFNNRLQQGKSSDPTNKGEVIYSDDDMESDPGSETEKKPLSKKKARKLKRLSVAELKQFAKKPEVVEWTDPSAADPRTLLHLKSCRNTVPIPTHWCAKRDYLQGKRGIEKPPFQLPAYIADTGIATMRDAVKEKEANMSLKAKTRERVQPKMGKVDIDYQKLHDAFFKFQTKPPVTGFGEMYVSP